MKILAIDVGGTHLKIAATDQDEIKVPSGPAMTAKQMVESVLRATNGWAYDVVAMGFPGPVVHGHPIQEPHNLGDGWVGFDFPTAFKHPVKIINDAAMQALGSYEGGRMLFIGLGTGLGTAMIIDKVIAPLELAHLPYRKDKTFEDYLGLRGLRRLGKKKWNAEVRDVVRRLQAALVADYVVLGGGNAKKVDRLPHGARMGDNRNAILGGYRLWTDYPG